MRDQRGFSLMELMMVMVIIGITFSIAAPNYLESQKRTKSTTCDLYRHNIQVATAFAMRQNAMKPGDTLPTFQELVDMGLLSDLHECPSGGTYVWPVATVTSWTSPLVTCSIHFVP
jgi:prepilin-type N-terminal cleavage/methylation domain-containing protein